MQRFYSCWAIYQILPRSYHRIRFPYLYSPFEFKIINIYTTKKHFVEYSVCGYSPEILLRKILGMMLINNEAGRLVKLILLHILRICLNPDKERNCIVKLESHRKSNKKYASVRLGCNYVPSTANSNSENLRNQKWLKGDHPSRGVTPSRVVPKGLSIACFGIK